MQPIYETPEDRARELAVVEQVAKFFKCQAAAFPSMSPVDWYLSSGKRLWGLVEVKTKNHKLGAHPHVHLDVNKFWPLYFSAMGFGVSSLYVVKFSDCIAWIDIERVVGLPVAVVGRTDRTATGDVRPAIEVPHEWFTRLLVASDESL